MRRIARHGLSLAAGAGGGALGALAGLALLPGPGHVVASAVLAACMAAIAAEDLERQRIPDVLNVAAALAGLAALALLPRDPWPELLAGMVQGVVCGVVFLLLRLAFFALRGIHGLGFGDVKLAAVAGVWLGWHAFAFAVLLAALAALVAVGRHTLAEGAWPRDRRIPFGLYLAPSVWVCWLADRLGALPQ
jgi:leader peptidase (prepilin peptidase)/N-methyltransferase